MMCCLTNKPRKEAIEDGVPGGVRQYVCEPQVRASSERLLGRGLLHPIDFFHQHDEFDFDLYGSGSRPLLSSNGWTYEIASCMKFARAPIPPFTLPWQSLATFSRKTS